MASLSMDRFVGRVALVSGVSSGVGAAVAEDLVRAGVVVVGVARREARLKDLAAKLANEKGQLHPLPADLSREEEVRRVYQWIDANLGGVSIVVNNAAMLNQQPMNEIDSSTILQMVNLNVTSFMLSCREALINMKKHDIQDGHIININSVAGHNVFNMSHLAPLSNTAYCTTKFGITALSKGLRFDVQAMGFRTRITNISPGGINTEMLSEEFTKNLPTPESLLSPKDVSGTVMYAISCPAAVEITELTVRPLGEPV